MTRHNIAGSACVRLTWHWLAAAALVAPAAILAAPSAATAAGHGLPAGCVASGANVTCTYGPVGAEQVFVVPPHVTSVHVTAAGAAGAPSAGFGGAAGGFGAVVTGTVSVGAVPDLFVEVGGNATGSSLILTCLGGTLCTGGWNGGGSGGNRGGGGGGASDVRTTSNSGVGTLGSRVLVAGGGGGGGSNSISSCPGATGTVLAPGGAGGNAGTNGAGASFCTGATGTSTGGQSGENGGGGGQTVVNSGGTTTNGDAGSIGLGGSSDGTVDEQDQGGGGGGVVGGGAGADIGANGQAQTATGASGGGGGSSRVLAGGSFAVSTVTAGSVVISYVQDPDNADLGITIKGPRSAAAGSRFSEALVVTNYGPGVALDVHTTASLPRHLSVITASGLVRRVNDGLRWTDAALRPGESVSYRITFGVAPAVNARVSLRGTTAATGTPDPNPNNNNAIAGIRLHAFR